MPGTGDSAIGSNHAVLQRGTVMGTSRTQGVDLAVILHQEDLSILDTFDLALDFVHVLDVREGRDVFQTVFLGHFRRL